MCAQKDESDDDVVADEDVRLDWIYRNERDGIANRIFHRQMDLSLLCSTNLKPVNFKVNYVLGTEMKRISPMSLHKFHSGAASVRWLVAGEDDWVGNWTGFYGNCGYVFVRLGASNFVRSIGL